MRKIIIQFIILVTSEAIYRLGQLVLTAYIARSLGVHSYGIVSTAQVIANYMSLVADAGTGLTGIKSVAEKNDQPDLFGIVVSSIFSARLIIGLLVYLCYIIILFTLLTDIHEIIVSVLAGAITLVTSLRLDWLLKGLGNSSPLIFFNSIGIAVSAVIVFTLVRGADDIYVASLQHVMPLALAALLTIIYVSYRYGKKCINISIDYANLLEVLRRSIPFALGGLVYAAGQVGPMLMLSAYGPSGQLGFYNAAYNIIFPIAGLAIYLMQSALPHLSSSENRANLNKIILMSMGFGLFAGSVIALLSECVIMMIYGEKYVPSIIIAQIFSIAIALQFVRQAMRGVLVSKNKQYIEIKSAILGTTVAIICGLFLVISLGAIGAAIAVCAGEMASVIILYFDNRQRR